MEEHLSEYIQLLKDLISIPSVSREELKATSAFRNYLSYKNIKYHVKLNNTWALNKYFDQKKPTILLNSHIDTIKPVKGYTIDPFTPLEKEGKLYGLGSNDAGGSLISLLATFNHFFENKTLPFNLILAITAEEEISGENGLSSIINELPKIHFAIIGEPTSMNLAIAEKGLLVLDCYAKGKSGHAARDKGINALYKAIEDIQKLRDYKFENVSDMLGPVKITVTQINAGTQHNVIPDTCHFVVDIRTNDLYTNKKAYKIIDKLLESDVKPRSFRLNSSGIPIEHPFVKKAKSLGFDLFGSPTTSDKALIPSPSVKIGPGDSSRSHTLDEYIYISEIQEGIQKYIKLLNGLDLLS